jgi:DNA-binding PadR family transcriptional regulator
MKKLQELELLLLLLINNNHAVNNTYWLTRLFGKTTVLPSELMITLKELVEHGYINISNAKNAINYYAITCIGQAEIEAIDIVEEIEAYAWKIDASGYVASVVFLMGDKQRLVRLEECYLLSNGFMLAYIKASTGRLPDMTILESFEKKKWVVKKYESDWDTSKPYILVEENTAPDNVFDYLMEPIAHKEKPKKGMLRIVNEAKDSEY